MNPDPTSAARKHSQAWWRRRWVTVGEVVGAAALIVALLGYLDAHRERREAQAERTQEQKVEVARAALVLTAAPNADGSRLTLQPMRPGQAVQSQRYRFPAAVLDQEMEVSAAQPQIDRGWVADGLLKALKASGGKLEGEGGLPVGIETRYIEDGEDRTDRSLYRLGYRIEKGGLFGGPKLVLQGLSLVRRGVGGDLKPLVDARWAQSGAPVVETPG